MGNVCSSGQKKKDNDNASEKSEESPSYQLAEKKEKEHKETKPVAETKEAPLADPEPISDVSTGQNTSLATNSPTNGNIPKGTGRLHQQGTIQATPSVCDSVSSTPQTVNAPCEIPSVASLPASLSSLRGKPITSRRTEKDRKIVIYVLAADTGHKSEKAVFHGVYQNLKERCACRGFEILISDVHGAKTESSETKVLDVRKWSNSPLEAQGGHEEAANCLAEISRHSNSSYIIPVLFLGTSLGTPLLPLTIESQDFTTALNTVENAGKLLLEKWYVLDNTSQPPCYRLKTKDVQTSPNDANFELNNLLTTLVEIFSKELRDSYLTTVVEQEINNTVLISQELAKRCVWIQTGSLPPKLSDNPSPLEIEMNRRLNNIHLDLKNQLSEKNLIRIPPSIQVQDEQLAAIMESLITTVIDSIVEEHSNKFSIPNCIFGVDKRLLSEIEAVGQHSKLLGQNCANFAIMDKLKSYVTGTSQFPLLIYGTSGSGKSVLAAKIMHNVHAWSPESSLILRYGNLTPLSTHIVSLFGSIAEQLSVLTTGNPCRVIHTLDSYSNFVKSCLEKTKIHIIIVIDSIETVNGLESLEWLPSQLSANVKIVLTANHDEADENSKGKWLIEELKKLKVPKENLVELAKFSDEQWRDVLSFGGGDFYAANGALQLPESWRNSSEKIPLQAKILWWLAWLGSFEIPDTKLPTIINKVFETIESKFSPEIVGFLLSMLVASKNGLPESDLIALFIESQTVKDCSPARLWLRFCWLMGPMLLHNDLINIMDKKLRSAALERYSTQVKEANRILSDYFKKQELTLVDKKGKYKCYNTQKLLQLPYYAFMIEKNQQQEQAFSRSKYLTDLQWIHDKLVATGCVQILSDIYLVENYLKSKGDSLDSQKHLHLLKRFIESHIRELNYDGDQFYALLYSYIQQQIKKTPQVNEDSFIKQWNEYLAGIKSTYLERLNEFVVHEQGENDKKKSIGFDAIMNLGGKGYFVASISTEREEICVWDVPASKKVRTLIGIPQPTSLCPVGEYGAAVLCRREIKVINLDEGKFKVTLKGVMNQKMPYFGLHDSAHLVCLSRNRMYVNLMNLESGDCVTTFKAGEDRFLNSLLVSGDGRILVCGDETQKPFPLLVWHLSQRKLLYDLRIPHHDFLTSLSAITHEGSYVCVVAKELNEPTPNFIVVYDLQSGTLFKKWKPSCNTVSLAISQTNACVIAGLEDARILIWDLVTGNCRCTLTGHNSPVTLLKLDPSGKVLLSGDKDGRDTSIRLWELDSGKSLAVYTPPAKISTCEILVNGKYVVLALENHSNLITLALRNYQSDGADEGTQSIVYGNAENDGKTFQL
uniref:Putative wd40 domain protein n=1 Tax=Tabanus bromius TaxID=304241 RepID=A0A0K8TLW2_TABBR